MGSIHDSPGWVGLIRAFIATDSEDVRLEALADCPEVCVRPLLGRADVLTKMLNDAEARVGQLLAARRFEEAAVVRLLAILPAARILKETTGFVPKAAEVAVPLCTSALQLSGADGLRRLPRILSIGAGKLCEGHRR